MRARPSSSTRKAWFTSGVGGAARVAARTSGPGTAAPFSVPTTWPATASRTSSGWDANEGMMPLYRLPMDSIGPLRPPTSTWMT